MKKKMFSEIRKSIMSPGQDPTPPAPAGTHPPPALAQPACPSAGTARPVYT